MCKRLIPFAVALFFLGLCYTAVNAQSRPDEVLAGSGLSSSIGHINLDRFPGEAELMKRLNQPDVRAWIHTLDNSYPQPEYWRYNFQPPAYYGQNDLLQMLQNHGVNVQRLPRSEEIRNLLSEYERQGN